MNKSFNRILIIKLRFHGDMLLTTPVIRTLKQQYPHAQVDVLLYEDTIPILSGNADIRALYGVKLKKSRMKDKIINALSLIRTLRANDYDLIINLTEQWFVALLLRLLPAQMKIGPDYGQRQSPLWKNSFTHLSQFKGTHMIEQNLSILAPLNIDVIDDQMYLNYQPKHWQKMHQRLLSFGVKQNYVVIQPTTRQFYKCWDNEKFAQLVDALQLKGLSVILTSGPSKEDLETINQIVDLCETKVFSELAGQTSFPELAALIDHATLYIGLDSAPMHMAAALHTPVVCLFGPTDHIFWRPWTDNAIVIWSGDHEKMPSKNQLDQNKKYLSAIPAADVVKAALELLSKNGMAVP